MLEAQKVIRMGEKLQMTEAKIRHLQMLMFQYQEIHIQLQDVITDMEELGLPESVKDFKEMEKEVLQRYGYISTLLDWIIENDDIVSSIVGGVIVAGLGTLVSDFVDDLDGD